MIFSPISDSPIQKIKRTINVGGMSSHHCAYDLHIFILSNLDHLARNLPKGCTEFNGPSSSYFLP